jgi:hypothetical protein
MSYLIRLDRSRLAAGPDGPRRPRQQRSGGFTWGAIRENIDRTPDVVGEEA